MSIRYKDFDSLKEEGFIRNSDGSWGKKEKTKVNTIKKPKNKKNKFGAVRTEVDGITFHSKGEAARYEVLKKREEYGVISNLTLQPKFSIKIDGHKICDYIADFQYNEPGTELPIVEDFKGKETQVFKLKKNMFLAIYGSQYEFRITKKPKE